MIDPKTQLVVFVDVDDTLVRWVGSKRMPIVTVVQHIRNLANDGAQLYCWSTGGAEYAHSIADDLGLASCFMAFLPKPQVMIDDQHPNEWRELFVVYPLQCDGENVDSYRERIGRR